jgi:hypothetical protein
MEGGRAGPVEGVDPELVARGVTDPVVLHIRDGREKVSYYMGWRGRGRDKQEEMGKVRRAEMAGSLGKVGNIKRGG